MSERDPLPGAPAPAELPPGEPPAGLPASAWENSPAYCVFACRKRGDIVGVWSTPWHVLEARLPGQALITSGARLKRFPSKGEAVAAFVERNGYQPKVFEA